MRERWGEERICVSERKKERENVCVKKREEKEKEREREKMCVVCVLLQEWKLYSGRSYKIKGPLTCAIGTTVICYLRVFARIK